MLRSTLVTMLLVASASVSAQSFDYNHVNVGYARTTLDDNVFDIDGDSFTIDGAFEIADQIFLFAGYSTGDLDEAGVSVDLDTLAAGIGWHTALSDEIDFVAGLSYEYIDLGSGGLSVDDNGLGLGVGLRFSASQQVEITGGINYVDYSDFGDDTSFALGALFDVTDNIAIGLSGEWGDDISTYGVSGRFYFGGK